MMSGWLEVLWREGGREGYGRAELEMQRWVLAAEGAGRCKQGDAGRIGVEQARAKRQEEKGGTDEQKTERKEEKGKR